MGEPGCAPRSRCCNNRDVVGMNVIECCVTGVDIDVQHSQIIVLEHRRMTRLADWIRRALEHSSADFLSPMISTDRRIALGERRGFDSPMAIIR